MTAALEGGEWSAARPGRTLPPGKTRYPFYSTFGGPQGRSGLAENLVPTGIRTRTVQPVVSHYTDWDTRPTVFSVTCLILNSDQQYGFHSNLFSWQCWLRHCATWREVPSSILWRFFGSFQVTSTFFLVSGSVVHSVSNINEHQRIFLGIKCGRCVELTAVSYWLCRISN